MLHIPAMLWAPRHKWGQRGPRGWGETCSLRLAACHLQTNCRPSQLPVPHLAHCSGETLCGGLLSCPRCVECCPLPQLLPAVSMSCAYSFSPSCRPQKTQCTLSSKQSGMKVGYLHGGGMLMQYGARPVIASVPDGAPAILLRIAADPLCWHGKTRARNAAEYLRATERCVAEMDTFTFPYLNFHRQAAFQAPRCHKILCLMLA